MLLKQIKETIIEFFIRASGFLIIAFVALVFLFLLKDSLVFFSQYSLKSFLLGKQWLPISDPEQFGSVPLVLGSLYVTFFCDDRRAAGGCHRDVHCRSRAPFVKNSFKIIGGDISIDP